MRQRRPLAGPKHKKAPFWLRWGPRLGYCALLVLVYVVRQHQQAAAQPVHTVTRLGLGFVPRLLLEEDPPTNNSCSSITHVGGPAEQCQFVKSTEACSSGTYFQYTQFFYCTLRNQHGLALLLLVLWLLVLFYTLGNTAADHFCPSLQQLSDLLNLPPSVAGVTLLPLGNGAPDVFASIAAFTSNQGQGDVGVNAVLGGGVFVTMVVAGCVALVASETRLPRLSFLRDVLYYLFSVTVLMLILFIGKDRITLYSAVIFISLYPLYGIIVGVSEYMQHKERKKSAMLLEKFLADGESGRSSPVSEITMTEDDYAPWADRTSLPQWVWNYEVALYSSVDASMDNRPAWGWEEETEERKWWHPHVVYHYVVEVPLELPRRLTIPDVTAEKWDQRFAVLSCMGAPLLLAVVTGANTKLLNVLPIWALALIVGVVLAGLAAKFTSPQHPPTRCLLPWLVASFVMSVMWIYLIASELVATLVTFGIILDVKAALLGVTVLAWGNSVGDLVANVAIARNGGAQMAFAGCYAGPMFNLLIGLGLSMCLATAAQFPAPYVIDIDSSIYSTFAFLVVSLLTAATAVPLSGYQYKQPVAIALLVLYGVFLVNGFAAIIRSGSD
eukprot:jgi/Chlat1/5098/Chrsp33S05114